MQLQFCKVVFDRFAEYCRIMRARSPRLFSGQRVRALRKRSGMSQQQMAQRLDISVSYLSQIENDERPLTPTVLLALARSFPQDWGDVGGAEGEADLTGALSAASDSSISGPPLTEDQLQRAIQKHPQLVERLVAVHAAYRRSQEQLRVLDDRVDSGGADFPWNTVRDWYQAQGNYIDPLDRAAEALAHELGGPTAIEARLRDHGLALADAEIDVSRLDMAAGKLWLSPSLPAETRHFELARTLCRISFAPLVQEVARTSGLQSETAVELLKIGLFNYAAAALVMPYTAYRQAAREFRHDIDQLRQRFLVSFEQACHRLSTLQRPGAAGVPFFFCRVDMAGNITKRHSATPLQFARFGGACPLWVVHEAVAIPDRILVQLGEMPDGTRYVSMAKGLVKPSGSYTRTPRRYAVALGCEESHAHEFVYADGLARAIAATPIGTSCRICPRTRCDQRAFPPAASEIAIDPDERAIVPYSFR